MNIEQSVKVRDQIDTMRLIAEGAAAVLESDAQPLFMLAMKHNNQEAALAFNTIQAAVTALRAHLQELQAMQIHDALQEPEPPKAMSDQTTE